MADLYISDSVFAQYVAAYGDDAKERIREAVEKEAPDVGKGGDGDA